MLRITCPKCQLQMQTADFSAGQLVACPKCGQQMRLPAAAGAPSAPPPPAPVPPPPPAAPPPTNENPFAGIGGESAPETSTPETEAAFSDMTRDVDVAQESSRLEALWREVPQPLPIEVAKLGTPRVIYTSVGKGSLLIKALVGTAGTAVLMLAAGLSKVKSAEVAKGVLACSGFMFTLVAVLIVLVVLARRSYRLIFFDDAMVFYKGGRFTVYPFMEVEEVRHNTTRVVNQSGFVVRVLHDVRIRMDDGRLIWFDNKLQSVERLSARVTHEAIRVQLPAALSRLGRGETIRLGDFEISREGLRYQKTQVPWVALETCGIHKATLICRRRFEMNNWLEVPASDIPSSFLLVALADVLMRNREL